MVRAIVVVLGDLLPKRHAAGEEEDQRQRDDSQLRARLLRQSVEDRAGVH